MFLKSSYKKELLLSWTAEVGSLLDYYKYDHIDPWLLMTDGAEEEMGRDE